MKRQRLTAVLVAAILVASAEPEAAEYHVSPDGDDVNPGSADAPFCTIQQAADTAQPGDTVVIHAGTYREAVELTRGGTADKPITFAAAAGDKVVLSGADPLAADWSRHEEHVLRAKTPIHVALVYTGLPTCAGSVVRYNWVHGCYTERVMLANRKLDALRGGLGIRGDDQTRSLTVHHNVVWNCGRDGIVAKGDHNRIYNNTVLNIGSLESTGNYIELPTRAEPKKWWRKQDPLLDVQNQHSRIANNVARTICDVMGRPHKFPDNMSNNYTGERPLLEDAESFRFWPKDGSPLIDAGTPLPGFTDGFFGAAPDIGAYEHGAEPWVPGIRWDPGEALGDTPRGFVSVR